MAIATAAIDKPQPTPVFPQIMMLKLGPRAPFPILGLMNSPAGSQAPEQTDQCQYNSVIVSVMIHMIWTAGWLSYCVERKSARTSLGS